MVDHWVNARLRYWRGQLTMEDQRNFANIEPRLEPGRDGQQLEQFMSGLLWSAAAVGQDYQSVCDLRSGPCPGRPAAGGRRDCPFADTRDVARRASDLPFFGASTINVRRQRKQT
jgi:hypothetical protein